jgi:hypothetical protein
MPGSIRIMNSITNLNAIPLDSGMVTIEGGSVARSLSERFGEVINVKDFGAVGDGIVDDTAAVQAAISAAPAGSTIKFGSDKHYYLKSLGTITKSLTIDGNGCQITCDITPISGSAEGSPLFSFSGTTGTYYTVTSAPRGSLNVTLTTALQASNFVEGDIVQIRKTTTELHWSGSAIPEGVEVFIEELSQVKSSDTSAGVITLTAPIAQAFSGSLQIRKLTPVIKPIVRNMHITELYSGYSSPTITTGPSAPNIIDMFCVKDPIVEDVYINGFNCESINVALSWGGIFRRNEAKNAYNPAIGGIGNLLHVITSRNVLCSNNKSENIRHTIDWATCIDCSQEFNVAHIEAGSDYRAAYHTHGYVSRNITSYCDTCYGGSGWWVGNPKYVSDFDVSIIGFRYYSGIEDTDISPIAVWGGTVNTRIRDCNIKSAANCIRLMDGCRGVYISGCVLDSSLCTTSSPAIVSLASTLFSTNTIPVDFVIGPGNVITGPQSGTAVGVEATGRVVVTDNIIIGVGSGIWGGTIANMEAFVARSNRITTSSATSYAVGLGTTGSYTPSGEYRLEQNHCVGPSTPSSNSMFHIKPSNNLVVADNRYAGYASRYTWTAVSPTVTTMLSGGARIDGGLTNSYIPQAYGDYFKDSQIQDTGAQISVLTVMKVYNELWTSAMLNINSGATTTAGVRWYNGASPAKQRWGLSSAVAETSGNTGYRLIWAAYDDNGIFIDNVLTMDRAAGTAVIVNRPLQTTSARVVKVTSITSTAGTTVIASSDHTVIVTGSTTHTLTLPAAANGRQLIIKNRSSGTITINRAGSDTIDGGTTFNLTTNQSTVLVANGTDWCRVANA